MGGLTAAIALRRQGFDVEIIEKDPSWKVYGVGIIQQSNVVRAMDALGLLAGAWSRPPRVRRNSRANRYGATIFRAQLSSMHRAGRRAGAAQRQRWNYSRSWRSQSDDS
jgi:2-polyprenyl-6-methoxyphenol hydroxylase-like FAD-dependent oxidoreductase